MPQILDSITLEKWGQVNASVLPPTVTSLPLNGTLTLNVASTTSQIIIGSVTGQSVVLPNATTLINGWTYRIYNLNSTGLLIKYNDGTTLVAISANAVIDCFLQSNSTTNGVWVVLTGFTSGGVSGTQEVNASVDTSTNSTSPGLIASMSITPVAGSYFAMFSMDCEMSNSSSTGYMILASGGVTIASSRRGNRGGQRSTIATQGLATVNGNQAIEAYWSVTAATFTSHYRSLTIVKYT